MKISEEHRNQLLKEMKFSASRSGGPGGQHVNKVNTKVELRFALLQTQLFSDEEKRIIQLKFPKRISADGELILVSSVERSQWRNKQKVIEKFFELIEKALLPTKKRVKTVPSRASRLKRMEGKKLLSKKKQLRKRPEL